MLCLQKIIFLSIFFVISTQKINILCFFYQKDKNLLDNDSYL